MANAEEPARHRRAARILRQGAEALGLSPVLPFPRRSPAPPPRLKPPKRLESALIAAVQIFSSPSCG